MTDETRSLNVVHYWRPSNRHQWRRGGTTVNVTDTEASPAPVRAWVDVRDPGYQYADIPYDWECWRPPKRARVLPGLTQTMLDMLPRT